MWVGLTCGWILGCGGATRAQSADRSGTAGTAGTPGAGASAGGESGNAGGQAGIQTDGQGGKAVMPDQVSCEAKEWQPVCDGTCTIAYSARLD
jgi:hypothetical protein